MKDELDVVAAYRYGSNDSDDLDVFIALNRIPSSEDDQDMLDDIFEGVSHTVQKNMKGHNRLDHSFIYISDEGIIEWCQYDDIDEANNALYHTYDHHAFNRTVSQVNPIKRERKQNISFKIVKVIRSFLTYLSRTEHRSEVKNLLKYGSFKERIAYVVEFVSNGHLTELSGFNKNLSNIEITKDIAFGFIQLYSLMNGFNVYCKKDACLHYPDLAPYILKNSDAPLVALEDFIIECFEAMSMNIEVIEEIDAVKYVSDTMACLNKQEEIIDLNNKRLQ